MRALLHRYPALGSLRFRLTLSYVLFVAFLLLVAGILFRQTVASVYDAQARHILTEEISAVRGYLRIEKPLGRSHQPRINWYYDRDDPEEAIIIDRLRQIYFLADAHGQIHEISPDYLTLPVDPPDAIREAIRRRAAGWKTLHDPAGAAYLIRTAIITAEDGNPWMIAVGRSSGEKTTLLSEFAWKYGWMLPLTLALTAVLGWFTAGKALTPLHELAHTAQRVTGSNLAVRIPPRPGSDEISRLIRTFNHMIQRLEASFLQARQFSTDVSHELRTPLTAVRGQLEVALLTATTPEQFREAIIAALEEVERLSQTIRALLLLSQAETGQLEIQKQPLALDALVADIVEQFQIPAEDAGVTLTLEKSGQVVLPADRIQMERLLSNLLSNALKYTPSGGKVEVNLAAREEQVQLVVSDNGVGIPPEHLPFIFDRFYRVPSATREGPPEAPEKGLGLGLSFVAWIVRAHGGTIGVRSSPGEGTAFTVLLPRYTEGVPPQGAPQPDTAAV